MAKFRWTRERFYKAQHLNRLLCQLPVNAPPLVDRYHKLMNEHYDTCCRRDPLLEHLEYRLERFKGDEIPF